MTVRRYILSSLIAGSSLLLPLMVGCGGAGNPNTGTTGAGGTSPVRSETTPDGNTKAEGQVGKFGLFLTASGAAKYDHVWATIQKVELVDVMEKPVTVYENPDGFTVDLKNLAQDKKLALVSVASAPMGKAYSRVRITFDKSLSLFDPGSNVAKSTTFSDAVARDEQDRPLISFPLTKPRDLGNGKESLVVEFPLDKLAVTDSRAVFAIKEGAEDASDTGRQEPGVFSGAVSDVSTTDAGSTFTLTLAPNRTLTIQTSQGTAYYNDGLTANPTLASGKQVTVRGVLAADTKRVLATEVTVFGDGKDPRQDVTRATLRGVVLSADGKTGTVALLPTGVTRIIPSLNAVTVLVAPDAALRSSGGLLLKNDDFYAALARPGTLARFEGSYEPVTGTFKATHAKIEEAKFNPTHEAEVRGVPKDVNATNRTLTLDSVGEWEGIALKEGAKPLAITTTAATAYVDDKGGFVATPTFFETAAKGENSVRITGIYSDGKITATRAELLPPLPKPKPDEKPNADAKSGDPKPGDAKPGDPAKPTDAKSDAPKPDDKPAEKPN